MDSTVEQLLWLFVTKSNVKTSIMYQDFYINIPSNTLTGQNAFQQNKTSDFRIALAEEINLIGDNWEVALVELQYPFSWNNITGHVSSGSDLKQNQFEIELTDYTFTKSIPPGYYGNAEALEAILFEVIDNVRLTEFYIGDQFDFDLRSLLWFNINKLRNKFILKCNDELKVFKHIRLSPLLRYIMGFESDVLTAEENIEIEAKYPPDMRAGLDSLFVYCDIIEPQLVGNKRAQVLRIVPVSGTYGDVVDKIFTAPHYVPVLNKRFATIHISIKTDQNKPVEFTSGKCVVKLHFRRRNKFQL